MKKLEVVIVKRILEADITKSGPPGPAGVGVPAGGMTGQVLSKASDNDYDTEWTTLATVSVPANLGVQGPNTSNIPFFRVVGMNTIRLGGLSPVPWNPQWNLANRTKATKFKSEGFWTQYGVVDAVSQGGFSHPITAANWPLYHDTVVAEATYCQSQGLIFDAFLLGNELENYIDNTTLTYVGLYDRLQQLALDVRAVYSGPLTYNFFAWPIDNYQGWYPGQGWNEGGIGNFDMIGIHPYPTITPPVVPTNETIENGQWVSFVPNDQFTYSLNFNGANTRVVLGNPPELTGLTDFTWAGWVKYDVAAKGTVWSNCFNFGGNNGQQITLGSYQNRPTIEVYQGNTSVITPFPVYTVGAWFFLAVTQVGSNVTIYVDGYPVLLNQPLQPRGPHASTQSYLGAEGGSGYWFNGEMCGVGIWDRGLTAQEMADARDGLTPQDGLVGHYLVPSGPITPASIDYAKIDAMLSSWSAKMGDKLYVSEFNIDSESRRIAGATPAQQREWTRTLFTKIKDAVGDNKIIFYKYIGTSYELVGHDSDGFNLQRADGLMAPAWDVFIDY